MSNVGFLSLGKFLPQRVLTNAELEQMVETSDEWIMTRTGIKERRIAGKAERTSHLAVKAAQQALAEANFDTLKLDLIIVATTSADSNFPSVACLVQESIQATNAAAFDVGAACSGFLYAVTTAKQFIKSGMYRHVLVIAAEKVSNLIDWRDRGTCVLFGDGAGACLLGPVADDSGILSDFLHAQGHSGELLSVVAQEREPLLQDDRIFKMPYVVMQGQELFKIAVNSMAEAVEVAAARAGMKIADIDCVVPHQANDRIISAVAKKLGVPKEKFFINIDKYGNMVAASIVVALCEAVEQGQIKKGDIVALVAFGAGLVSAANIVRW